jgi:glutamyl-tRNA synthetase
VDEEGKKKHLDNEEKKENMRIFADSLEGLETFSQEGIEGICRDIVEERGIKAGLVIHPTRMAISGKTKGAGLFEIMEVLGKEKVINRMKGLKR